MFAQLVDLLNSSELMTVAMYVGAPVTLIVAVVYLHRSLKGHEVRDAYNGRAFPVDLKRNSAGDENADSD